MNKGVKIYDASMIYPNFSLKGISFSYDGKSILYSSNETGYFNVYRIFIFSGKTEQLTRNINQSAISISYFPYDNRFLFMQDSKGDELFHIWVCEENFKIQDLSPGINVKAKFLQWSYDGKYFWMLHNQRDSQSFDVYRYRSRDYQSQQVFKNREALTVCAISKNGRWIICEKEHDNYNNSLFLYDISKEKKFETNIPREICITDSENIARFSVLCFSPDSKKVFYTSNYDSEFKDVWCFDIEAGKKEKIIQAGWDVNSLYFSPSGRYRVSEINQNSTTITSIHDLITMKVVPLPKLSGFISQVHFSKDEHWIAFFLESCVSPPELYLVNLENKSCSQLITPFGSESMKNNLVTANVIRYTSFDELEIPSLIYRPHIASSNNKVPAMIWVHGGPGDQSSQTFEPLIQYLVNHGYAVFAINHRGSRGYGKTFFHLTDRKHGDLDIKDCIYGRKYLETQDWIDSSYIGIMGSSYGGYIATASLAFKPDAFNVAISISGVTNWVRTLSSIPSWMTSTRRRIFSVMGDPSVDKVRLKSISPYFYAANICRPLLIIQGKNDPRVLKAESDTIVKAVRDNGVSVEYLVFENEGHEFFYRKNLITMANTCLSFLNQNLEKELN